MVGRGVVDHEEDASPKMCLPNRKGVASALVHVYLHIRFAPAAVKQE